MREAIGGSWILSIVVVFIFLFLFFLTYSINYTRAFNVKNEIINYIEHAEGFTEVGICGVNSDDIGNTDLTRKCAEKGYTIGDTVQAKAYTLIKNTGYDYDGVKATNCTRQDPKATHFEEGGYCIVKVCQDNENTGRNTYYKVTTFITMKIPLLGIGLNIPVSGQTRTIYYDQSGYTCDY